MCGSDTEGGVGRENGQQTQEDGTELTAQHAMHGRPRERDQMSEVEDASQASANGASGQQPNMLELDGRSFQSVNLKTEHQGQPVHAARQVSRSKSIERLVHAGTDSNSPSG